MRFLVDIIAIVYYPYSMPSLITKWKKGKPYMYWVRSARVNGQPRIVEQVYLGPRNRVMQQIHDNFTTESKEKAPELKRVQIKEFGASALLYSLAEELDLVQLINAYIPQPARRTALSVGHYLMISAINRVVCPKSKSAFAEWYNSTVLCRLIPATKEELSSQRFWDHMDMVEPTHIEMIQKALLKKSCNLFAIDKKFLIYDTTNYYTFISTFNVRSSLPQRGRNKQKRSDLRQISLAVVTDEHNGFPLYHSCYRGNLTDVMAFQPFLESMMRQFQTARNQGDFHSTIILDKGNVSAENLKAIKKKSLSFITAIPANWMKELYNIPLKDYKPLSVSDDTRVKAYCVENTPLNTKLGIKGKAVIVFSPTFYRKQIRTLDMLQHKAEAKLQQLASSLLEKKRTEKSVRSEVESFIRHDRLKQFFSYTLTTDNEQVVRLEWKWDSQKKIALKHCHYGKTILYTDRLDLSDERIVAAYRSQSKLEQVFRISKSRRPGLWWPAYHWTDSKLRVHAFTCFLALVLLKIILLRLEEHRLSMGVEALIDRLRGIQEAKLIYVNGECQKVIVERTQQQEELFDALNLNELAEQLGNTVLNS
jgi:transposase